MREVVVRKAFDQHFGNDDPLLLGSRRTAVVDLSGLHPEPVHIFKLWQTYLDNVNPLLKVTHVPSLQGRIIEAAGNLSRINPYLEALMFSIYCIAILSLTGEVCHAMFGSSKEHLLDNYQFACQQALWNCGLLRSSDRDCLTALYLYLVSVARFMVSDSKTHKKNEIRSQFILARTLVLFPPCSVWQSASRSAWAFQTSRATVAAPFSRRKCAEGSGGRSCSSMRAWANWPTTRPRCWVQLGTAEFHSILTIQIFDRR